MSRQATQWVGTVRELKPTARLILLCLADHHNEKTGRCDPSQERLIDKCEVRRSTLNVHLADLEAKGLIKRYKRRNPRTKKPATTYYKFAFDVDFLLPPLPTDKAEVIAVKPRPMCPKSGHDTVSENRAYMCPESDPSQVQNPDTNQGKENKENLGRKADRSVAPALHQAAMLIRTGKSYLCQQISKEKARELVAIGLVTTEECAKVDLRL